MRGTELPESHPARQTRQRPASIRRQSRRGGGRADVARGPAPATPDREGRDRRRHGSAVGNQSGEHDRNVHVRDGHVAIRPIGPEHVPDEVYPECGRSEFPGARDDCLDIRGGCLAATRRPNVQRRDSLGSCALARRARSARRSRAPGRSRVRSLEDGCHRVSRRDRPLLQ